MKWASITLQHGQSYRDADGNRVDMIRLGDPDVNGICFVGTLRDNARKMYRADGTSPDAPSIEKLWPADEPDRYFAITYDADQGIFGVLPTRYADLGQLRRELKAEYALRLGPKADSPGPECELIAL